MGEGGGINVRIQEAITVVMIRLDLLDLLYDSRGRYNDIQRV